MKKINILKENKDFDRIIMKQKAFKGKYYYIYVERNDSNNTYKFGISVSKKIGNAVTRNLYKRRIKSILDKNIYEKDFTCIIILKKSVLEATYSEIENMLIIDLKKLKIIKE